ncbi:unnamed protein product [Phaeothamnion confervicola]
MSSSWALADDFVTWCGKNDALASRTVFLVTPGQGLDALVTQLGETIGFDAQTLKVLVLWTRIFLLSFPRFYPTRLQHDLWQAGRCNPQSSWRFASLRVHNCSYPPHVQKCVCRTRRPVRSPATTISMQYVLLLFAAYPMSFIFARLPSANAKHAFSFAMGLWMLQFIYMSQWVHSFITVTVTYLMVRGLPNKIMPYAVFAFVMTYICAAHLYRMYVDYMGWSLDFTGPQMVLTIKLSSFAFNVYDGRCWDKISKPMGEKRKDKVNESRCRYALREVPSALAYYGHMYCFTSILAGPAFEFTEYIGAVTGGNYKRGGNKSGAMPPNALAALRRLFVGVLCLGLHLAGTPSYPLSGIPSPEVLSKPWLPRYAWMWLALLFVRVRYYFAWQVADGGAVLAGFGFEGYDEKGRPKWDGVSNMDIWAFETSQNVAVNARAWNKRTQGWLERYVYNRTGNSLTATYFMSAFWHGFYPGYYLFFMSLPLATSAGRVARKKIRPYFMAADCITPGPYKKLYDAVTLVCVCVLVNYMVIPFQLLAWDTSMRVWGSYYFAGHVGVVLVYLVCMAIPMRRVCGGNGKGANGKNGGAGVANGVAKKVD